jgi:hypothetical protein
MLDCQMDTGNLLNRFRSSIFLVFLVSCFNALPALGASSVETSVPPLSIDSFLPDFDGDNKLDRASLSSNGQQKTIHVALGNSSRHSLSFDSDVADRGALISGDVDEDGDLDLIWISQSARKFVAWRGDGHGKFLASSNSHASFDQFAAFLPDAGHGHLEQGNKPELTGILSDGSFITPSALRNREDLHRAARSVIDQPILSSSTFSVLTLRGPPSKLF